MHYTNSSPSAPAHFLSGMTTQQERTCSIICIMFMSTSSSKSTHSPAAYCFSNDVSVWVAPALIKAGATQTEMLLLKQYAAGDHELLDDYDVLVRIITETCLHLVEFRSWQSCEHSRSDSQKGEKRSEESDSHSLRSHCPGCQLTLHFSASLFFFFFVCVCVCLISSSPSLVWRAAKLALRRNGSILHSYTWKKAHLQEKAVYYPVVTGVRSATARHWRVMPAF